MIRKRIALPCLAVVLGTTALLVPLATGANAGTELSAKCTIVEGSDHWWTTGNVQISNAGPTPYGDWTVSFELSGGHATADDPGTFDLKQEGKRVTVRPRAGQAVVPAEGHLALKVGINPQGKSTPDILDCRAEGSTSGGEEESVSLTAPTDKGSYTIDDKTVHLMWAGVAGQGSGIIRYEIFRDGKQIDTTDGSVTMTDVGGLQPATSYVFKVRAVDDAGNRSPFSADITLRTHGSAAEDSARPEIPSELDGEAVGPNQVALRWQAGTDDVAVTGYRIYRDGLLVENAKGTSATLSGLKPNTGYKFKVTAVDSANNESQPTRELALRTPSGVAGGVAGAPKDFAAATISKQDGAVTLHYLRLGWTVPKGHGQIGTYQVHLNGSLAQTFMWGTGDPVLPVPSGSASREVLVGPNPGKTYKVKIRALLGDGTWGAFSQEKTVTTSH